MHYPSADAWVAAMNAANYLGHSNWQHPTTPVTDKNGGRTGPNGGSIGYGYKLDSLDNALGFKSQHTAAPAPANAVGPFSNIQPHLYWSQASAGATQGNAAFSFSAGWQGANTLPNFLYVWPMIPGRLPGTSPATGQGLRAKFRARGPSSINPAAVPIARAFIRRSCRSANAKGESFTIAPNTWVEMKGSNLAPAGDTRIWQTSDFASGKMPTQLDGVSVVVNGKRAYAYNISPTQINILTPPNAVNGRVQVIVTNNGTPSASFTAPAQALSPSFFVFKGGPYVTATDANGTLLGPTSLYPGSTIPAKPGETIVHYANGFGQTSAPVESGSILQSGSLSPQPVIKFRGIAATAQFTGLVSPGEFHFNVAITFDTPDGDQSVSATYNSPTIQAGRLIAIQH